MTIWTKLKTRSDELRDKTKQYSDLASIKTAELVQLTHSCDETVKAISASPGATTACTWNGNF